MPTQPNQTTSGEASTPPPIPPTVTRNIRLAFAASLISATVTAVLAVVSSSEGSGIPQVSFLDVIIILLLAIGIYCKSTLAAVLMLLYYCVGQSILSIQFSRYPSITSLAFVFAYGLGVKGCRDYAKAVGKDLYWAMLRTTTRNVTEFKRTPFLVSIGAVVMGGLVLVCFYTYNSTANIWSLKVPELVGFLFVLSGLSYPFLLLFSTFLVFRKPTFGRIVALLTATIPIVCYFVLLSTSSGAAASGDTASVALLNRRQTVSTKQSTGLKTPGEVFQDYSDATVLIVSYNQAGAAVGFATGFNIDPTGLIVTNYHVLAMPGTSAKVFFPSHGSFEQLSLVAYGDAKRDLALIGLNASALPVVAELSHDLGVGDRVFVIGSPQGLVNTLSDGMVSGIRKIEEATYYQISAPISHGSSGAPVFNAYGQAVAVVTSTLEQGQNLNFAIPISELSHLTKLPSPMLITNWATSLQLVTGKQQVSPNNDNVESTGLSDFARRDALKQQLKSITAACLNDKDKCHFSELVQEAKKIPNQLVREATLLEIVEALAQFDKVDYALAITDSITDPGARAAGISLLFSRLVILDQRSRADTLYDTLTSLITNEQYLSNIKVRLPDIVGPLWGAGVFDDSIRLYSHCSSDFEKNLFLTRLVNETTHLRSVNEVMHALKLIREKVSTIVASAQRAQVEVGLAKTYLAVGLRDEALEMADTITHSNSAVKLYIHFAEERLSSSNTDRQVGWDKIIDGVFRIPDEEQREWGSSEVVTRLAKARRFSDIFAILARMKSERWHMWAIIQTAGIIALSGQTVSLDTWHKLHRSACDLEARFESPANERIVLALLAASLKEEAQAVAGRIKDAKIREGAIQYVNTLDVSAAKKLITEKSTL